MEVIIHLLIHEYKVPGVVRDIALAAIVLAMACTVTWQWFRKEEKKQRRISIKWIVALIVAALIIYGGYRLWRGFVQPKAGYEDLILLEVPAFESQEIQKNLVEYLLLRSITASTKLNVIAQDEFAVYKKKTESAEEKPGRPIIFTTCEVYPKATGFEIFISLTVEGKELQPKTFECKGPADLMTNTAEEILSFISEGSNGKIEGGKSFSQICTGDLNALEHFLKGEEARKKLEREAAINPNYAASHLNMVKIHLHNNNLDEALKEYEKSLDLLTDTDRDHILRAEAKRIEKRRTSLSVSN